jgi:hypothetical protein
MKDHGKDRRLMLKSILKKSDGKIEASGWIL